MEQRRARLSRITRADVAKAAGVSGGTVARVLGGHKDVAPSTRERVLMIIDELGYQPDLLARALRSGKTHQLGLIVPDERNPYFHDIASGVGQEAAERGYSLILGFTKWGYDRVVQGFLGRKVDAIVSCLGEPISNEIGPLVDAGIPICTCGYELTDSVIPRVMPDNFNGAKSASEYLASLGHSKIALFFGGPTGVRSLRVEGWLAGLDNSGLQPAALIEGGWRFENGPSMVDEFKRCGATAALFENDMMALGFTNAAVRRGLRIPEDVSIVGFDDIWLSQAFSPKLTTVRSGAVEMGRLAAQLALETSDGEFECASVESVPTLIVPTELKVRESTRHI